MSSTRADRGMCVNPAGKGTPPSISGLTMPAGKHAALRSGRTGREIPPLDHWPQVRAGLFRRGSARGFGSSAAGRVRNHLASVADRLLKQLSDLAESEQDVDRLDGLVVLQDVVERAGTERHAEAGLVHE